MGFDARWKWEEERGGQEPGGYQVEGKYGGKVVLCMPVGGRVIGPIVHVFGVSSLIIE